MSDRLFLGRPAFDPKPFTRVAPLAVAEAGTWKVYGDWSNALPTEGRAFAPRLPGFSARCLLAFGVEPHPKADHERDQFVVAKPGGVCEVLDYREVDGEAARCRLVEIGYPYLLPGSDSVVAALAGGLCVVVRMVRDPSRDLWVADIAGLEHLPTRVFDGRLFAGDQVEGRWVTVPGFTVGAMTGMVNWCRDSDFLESVLNRIRRSSAQAPAGGLTRQQLRQTCAQLVRADLLPGSGADLEAMRDRLRAFAPSLGQNIGVLDEIVEVIGALAPVQDRLAAELSEQRAALERDMRQELEDKLVRELDASFTELTQERDGLAGEVEALATNLKAKRMELDGVSHSVEAARSGLAADLTRLLGELGEAPLPTDMDIARLGGLLAARLGDAGAAFEVAAGGGPPWTTPRRIVDEPKAWAEFPEALRAAALRWGYATDDLRVADVAVRGGALVVLPEECASRFVGCYADLVAGGGYVRHVLDPSVISIDDLWRSPGSGRHGCLARAWAAARLDPARFQVLLLDGLHRTPSALWVGSLLDVLRDTRRPRNLLIFASLGTPSVDRERAWRGESRAAVALAPSKADGLPPVALGRAVGAARTTAHFDAVHAPAPTGADVMSFVGPLEDEASAEALETACDFHRAAWPFGADQAASFACAVAGLRGVAPAGLATGNAWLRARLQDDD